MTPEEFAIARGKLGWSDGQLAAELNASEKIVRAWADGSVRIPKRDAQLIEWRAGLAERQAALDAAGLGECEWVKAWDAEPLPKRTEELDRHFKRVDEHAASCPRCQARERFLRDRFPPMPEAPRSPMLSGFMAWDRFLARFPAWTRPVINGAAIVTALVAIRVVLVLPRHASWTMLYALVIGAALGAAGGLTYSALRPYIAAGGVRKVIAYLLVLATYLALPAAVGAYGDQMGFSPIGALVVLGIVGVVVALWQLGRRRTN